MDYDTKIMRKNFIFLFFFIIARYHQDKTSIGLWCKQSLNPKFFIRRQKTLLVKLIKTHVVELLREKEFCLHTQTI